MDNYFVIPSRLCSLNDYIGACRANKYRGAALKKEQERICAAGIKIAKTKGFLRPVTVKSIVRIDWHCKDKRRDVDNIQSAQKYILDAMQQCGIIPNDNRRYVAQIYHEIIDDTSDYVVVKIEEAASV